MSSRDFSGRGEGVLHFFFPLSFLFYERLKVARLLMLLFHLYLCVLFLLLFLLSSSSFFFFCVRFPTFFFFYNYCLIGILPIEKGWNNKCGE